MEQKEDIGSFIKSKLQEAERTSNEPTWDRIQHSLEERKKRRMSAFYIKLGTAGLLLIISALYIVNSINTEDTIVPQQEIISEIDNKATISKEKNNKNIDVASHNTAAPKNNHTKDSVAKNSKDQEVISQKNSTTLTVKDFDPKTNNKNITVTTNSKRETPQTTTSNEIISTKTIDTIVNRNDVPVTQTTQKVYYYYNSKNGQEMTSTNKETIDSIVKMNERKQDSIKPNN